MQIVFMNRLSKTEQGDEALYAQLWIGEEEGVWRLGWRSFEADGGDRDTLWYEGGSWSEMLCIYRHELAGKLGEGYRPLIDGMFHEEETSPGRGLDLLRLQFYSETAGSEEVFERLCAWRRSRSASERKAPYLLASNRLLRLLSAYLPRSEEELLQIPGVGDNKARQYGEDWLAITAAAERGHSFPLDWVKQAVDEEAFVSWTYRQKEMKYKKQLDKLRLRRLLLKGIGDGLGIEQLMEESGVGRRELLEELEELEKDGYSVDRLIDRELLAFPAEEATAARNAFQELGDQFLKPVLLKVYGTEPAPAGETLDVRYERLRLLRLRFRRETETVRRAAR